MGCQVYSRESNNCTAKFSEKPPPPQRFTLTVGFDPDQGTATVDPLPPRLSDGPGFTYNKDTSVNLHAIAFEGYKFSHWDGDNYDCVNGHVKMTRNIHCEAHFKRVPKINVILLLHGTNSSPKTWDPFVSRFFPGGCPIITAGNPVDKGEAFARHGTTVCYRIDFGYYDHKPRILRGLPSGAGLPDAYGYAEKEGLDLAGDFSIFDELGDEVNRSIKAVADNYPEGIEIVLIAHSRGGLAARAFLQNGKFRAQHASVVGLVTLGTPHGGTYLGRVYRYLAQHPEGQCRQPDSSGTLRKKRPCRFDWDLVRFLIGEKECELYPVVFPSVNITNPEPLDLRRPTVGYQADNSVMLRRLNTRVRNLPTHILYAELIYAGLPLGHLQRLVRPFPVGFYSVFNRRPKYDVCFQMSLNAQKAVIGDLPLSDETLLGDGLVTADQQSLSTLPGFRPGLLAYKKIYTSRTTHVEQTKKVNHIGEALGALFPWWSGN